MGINNLSRRAIMKVAALGAASTGFIKSDWLIGQDALPDSPATPASMKVTDLRCEYRVNPLGIDIMLPRFSWITKTGTRSWKQSAYQILVASGRDRLANDKADLWNSGKVHSSQAGQVAYAGQPLRARQQCWWKVRVWDGSDFPSPWSDPAFWTMGLLNESDWRRSQWIGRDDLLEDTSEIWYFYESFTAGRIPPTGRLKPPRSIPAPYLRNEFVVSGRVRSAYLFASGLAYAELRLNGKKISGDIERDPGYTNFNTRVLYVTHDVTGMLTQGLNAVGAILGTGWYDVHDIGVWHFNTAPWRGRPRLRLLLAIEYEDGRSQSVESNDEWKTATGPILHDGIYTGEIYDARLEMPGWDTAGFDDSSWSRALIMPAPYGKLVARRCPPVAITETLIPVSISEPKSGEYLFDMGQNFSGHTELRVRETAGTAITMHYGEVLSKNGTVDTSILEVFMAKTDPRQPFQQDTYICKGSGEEVWEQRFSYSGFQYVSVTGLSQKPSVDNFRGRFAHTLLESAGEFVCSNEVINKIQHATRSSFLSNAQSIPTDCPQREKNGWTADAQLAAQAGLMNFKSASFYTKWLDDFADAQRADGGIPVIVPCGGWGNNEGGWGPITPPWDAAYPVITWDLYQYCGDIRILRQHYPHLLRYLDYFASYEKNGVTPGLGYGDWLSWKTETPLELISTAYLYLSATIVANIASILGMPDNEKEYRELAEKVKRGFNAQFYKTGEHTYANGSQTALSVALMFGLVPESETPAVLSNLIADVEQKGHIDTGFIGAKYVLHALSKGGRTDLAFKVVVRPDMPGWGYWIRQGATTLWEDWGGTGSRNHIMFGDVSNWFFERLAGISPDPAAPGFQRVLIRPSSIPDLDWAKGTYHSVRGMIVSDWKRSEAQFSLNLTIPANVGATVWIPAAKADHVTESGRDAAEAEGVRLLQILNDRRIFFVGSGEFAFEVCRS